MIVLSWSHVILGVLEEANFFGLNSLIERLQSIVKVASAQQKC